MVIGAAPAEPASATIAAMHGFRHLCLVWARVEVPAVLPSALATLWLAASLHVLLVSGPAARALAEQQMTEEIDAESRTMTLISLGKTFEARAKRSAQGAIRALMDMVPDTATVLRGGERRGIPAAELVPGDVVFLESGDKVPADLQQLIEAAAELTTHQSLDYFYNADIKAMEKYRQGRNEVITLDPAFIKQLAEAGNDWVHKKADAHR